MLPQGSLSMPSPSRGKLPCVGDRLDSIVSSSSFSASHKPSTWQTLEPFCLCLQRGRSTVDCSPEQLPATPLAPSISGSPHESCAAVTPAASLQARGSGSNPLVSAKGSLSQPLLAAALSRAAEGNHPSTHSPAKALALPTSAPGAFEPNSPRSRASLRPVSGATEEAATAAGNLAQARNPSLSSGEQAAALRREDEATSSASFDSWHSRNCEEDSTTTPSTSKPADTTAVGPSRPSGSKTPIAAAAVAAQGSSPLVLVSKTTRLFTQRQLSCFSTAWSNVFHTCSYLLMFVLVALQLCRYVWQSRDICLSS